MKVLEVLEMAKERKKGQRRIDLFRCENLVARDVHDHPGAARHLGRLGRLSECEGRHEKQQKKTSTNHCLPCYEHRPQI